MNIQNSMPRIARLTSLAYAHEYFVDGSPVMVDAFFGDEWHSVLAGGSITKVMTVM